MMNRTLKRKLLKTKITLNQTIQKILEINRKRKKLPFADNPIKTEQDLSEELRILNRIAAHQANLIRHYESALADTN